MRLACVLLISTVWEVKFDRSHPNNLFTCSQDGGLWHWDVNSATSGQHATTSLPPLTTPHPPSTHQPHPPSEALPTTTNGLHMATQGSEGVEGGQAPSLTSPWLSGAVQHGNIFIQDFSPSQGLSVSVNSLDIESKHLICSTDKEALFVVPNLTLR